MLDPMPGDIFRPGQVLNNTYEIEGVIGRGGTGEAYRARNQISGRTVAIKALNRQFSGNDDYIALMRREEQMRDIVHDAVVRYSECSRSDQGQVFLVMDYVAGPSISDVMVRRRLEPRELLIIAHRVAEGLVAAHGRGIVHRDLSPDNIILRDGSPERATIIDFGIAKDTAAGARTIVGNEFAGKYEYAAPEQLEGKAEPRSDLYALGALLLAGFRGQVPFAGATPGEMIRRKQSPLDTTGVPEPLKGVVEALCAPRITDRPANAQAVVARLGQILRPAGGRGRPQAEGQRSGRGGLIWAAGLALALIAGAGAGWQAGLFAGLTGGELPLADPWRLSAAAPQDGTARFSGNAPDADTAVALARAYGTAAGVMPPDDALTLASGMPGPDWPQVAAAGLDAMQGLQDWQIDLTGRQADIAALAPDTATRDAVATRLDGWAATAGLTLNRRIAAGPRSLPAATVAEALAALADCGPLAQSAAPEARYALGDTITVTGTVATEATAQGLRAALLPAIGDRRLQIDTPVLTPDLCAVRAALPQVAPGGLSLWFGDGDTGAANLSGIFHAGQNPIAEVQAPADAAEGALWVAIVDTTGKVYNILPNIHDEEQALARLGTVENGLRRVRVLHRVADLATDPNLLAMRVTDGDFGKSEVVAILSRRPLFATRRPTEESVASFAAALTETHRADPGNVLAVASRILDSRP